MKNHFAIVLLIFFFRMFVHKKITSILLIGTYTQKNENKGIYDFNTNTGDFSFKNSENVVNPSFLTVSKDNTFVYSVNEFGAASTVSSLVSIQLLEN
jgi:6-phosphogluconolactonase